MLILHEHSGPHSVSDLFQVNPLHIVGCELAMNSWNSLSNTDEIWPSFGEKNSCFVLFSPLRITFEFWSWLNNILMLKAKAPLYLGACLCMSAPHSITPLKCLFSPHSFCHCRPLPSQSPTTTLKVLQNFPPAESNSLKTKGEEVDHHFPGHYHPWSCWQWLKSRPTMEK